MKVSAYFGDKFLNADSFTKEGTNFEIISVKEDRLGNDEKMVAVLRHLTTGEIEHMPLNRTNALALSDLFGDDTDDWSEKAINVYRDMTMYQGKRVGAMRVRAAVKAAPAAAAAAAAAADSKQKGK